MAASEGVVGLTTQIKIGDAASPEVFTVIGEAKDIDGPEISQEFADFTHMQSTGGFRERKPTFKSSGQITFKCNYVDDNTQQVALIAAANANPATLKHFQLLYPDTSLFTFSAYPSVKFTSPMSGPIELAVTLSLEGAFTLT